MGLLVVAAAAAFAVDPSGQWTKDRRCVVVPEPPACLEQHLGAIRANGRQLVATYARVSSALRREHVADGAPWFEAELVGTRLSGSIWVYFQGAEARGCPVRVSVPLTGEVSAAGTELVVEYDDLFLRSSTCETGVEGRKIVRWYRSGDGLASHSPAGCAEWVRYRDVELPLALDRAVADVVEHRSARDIALHLAEVERDLATLEAEGRDAQAIDALARAVELAATRFLGLASLAVPASAPLLAAADGAKCIAKADTSAAAALAWFAGLDFATVQAPMTACLVDLARADAAERLGGPAASVVTGLEGTIESVRSLARSQEEWRDAVYDVRRSLARVRTELARHQEAVDRTATAGARLAEVNRLQLQIAWACGR